MQSERAWSYYPNCLRSPTIDECLLEFGPLTTPNSSRNSCYFTHDLEMARKYLPGYAQTAAHLWEASPLTLRLKQEVEDRFSTQFDYVLVHIYSDGQSTIGWHNDKESLFEEIVSVSFGTARRFRLKPIGQKSGWTDEYQLRNGDIFHMHQGCQLKFVHTVPVESRVTAPRVNFTFRKFDPRALIYRAADK